MKTHFRRLAILVGCAALSAMLSACVTDRHDALRSSTARLDRASTHFVSQIRYQGDDSRRDRLSRDAELMARSARKLDADVDRGEPRTVLADDYRQVEDSYDQLHRQLADEGYAEQNRLVLEDFDRVTAAYRDVQSAMVVRTADADIRR